MVDRVDHSVRPKAHVKRADDARCGDRIRRHRSIISNMNQTLFDSCGEFEISIRGGKSVTLRYPTDDQMARYQARVKIVTKRVGRDGTTTDIQGVEAAALELWEAIRVSGDDLDEFEAAYVVERLTTAEADEVEREGDDFRIHLDLIGGMRTSHLLLSLIHI